MTHMMVGKHYPVVCIESGRYFTRLFIYQILLEKLFPNPDGDGHLERPKPAARQPVKPMAAQDARDGRVRYRDAVVALQIPNDPNWSG